MVQIAPATRMCRLLRRAGWPAAVVAASTALGVLLLPYANTLVALLLPNALAVAMLLTVAVISERRRVEARTQRAEGELRAAESRARAAEACLLDAIDSLNEGFVLFDADDRLVLCNRKYRDLYAISADLLQAGARFEEIIREGAKRGQYVEAMGRIETWVAERLAQHRNPLATVLQQLGDGRWVLIREDRTRDGGTVGVWTDVSRLKNQELLLRDREQRLERTIEDLGESRGQMRQLTTEMTRLARENAAHRERAEASNAAKSQFLATVSHELRTPLNAILGFSEILKTKLFGPLGAPQYESYVCDIHESGVLLLNLINDLLDLSKVEAGKFVLQEDICDVLEIAEAALRVMAERAAKAGVTLEPRFAALPPIRADERKIKQILLNLLSNAVKFTPQGGRIRISAAVDAAGGVTFAVADTGIGIATHQIKRVLEPFAQVQNIMTRAHAGTGLGLPLCKALVELHGGTLTLASEVGSGTTVTVVLPKERVSATSPAASAA
jgi:two-component system cell cycle sensor histidine kinase PleC